ncbi:MAG: hypothetical protein ACI8Z1_003839 [Candidatus Azotimanducaceae bacterium]|jgi:hypothetical protein
MSQILVRAGERQRGSSHISMVSGTSGIMREQSALVFRGVDA